MVKNAGTELRETDLSTIVAGPGATIGAAVIWSEKGPFEERFYATSTKRFREKFGAEAPGLLGHYSVIAALQQGPVWVVRTALAGDNPLFGGVSFIENGGTGANAAVAAGVPDPDAYTFTGDECVLIVGADPGAWNNDLKVTLVHHTLDASEVVGVGNGVLTNFTGILANLPVKPSSVTISAVDAVDAAMVVTDDGAGALVGDIGAGANTIDYVTGAFDVDFVAAVKDLTDVTVVYTYATDVFTIGVWAPDSEGNYVEVESWDVSRVVLKKDGFGKAMYMVDVINGNSDYIYVVDNTLVAEDVPPEEQLTQLQFDEGDVGTIATAADIAAAWDTYFKNKNEVSVKLLIAGGWDDEVVSNKLSEICGIRQDCVAVLDTANVAPATAITNREALSLIDPSYCVMYFPWVKDTDEVNDKKVELPPSGYVAAAIMKKNTDGNIWDAAFGIDTGVIPVEGLVYELDEPTQELLAQAEINPIINKPGVGTVIWGGRTLQPYDSSRSWLNVRELLNMSEQANLDYLERFIGKNNTTFVRLQVKSGLDAHYVPLIGDAYYDVQVVCDESNNPGAVIAAGELHVDVYVQPVIPINRIVLQVVITRTGVSLTEVAAGVAA